MFFRPSKAIQLMGLPLVCLAMFSVAGGHWAVLQTVAWGQMLVTYSKEAGSFVLGAKKTFSGDYPCSMCRKVAEGKKKEKQELPQTIKTDKKAEVALVDFGAPIELPLIGQRRFFSGIFFFPTRSDAPPSPVPIVRA